MSLKPSPIQPVPEETARVARDRGLAKTHLQHVTTAAAINLERLAVWFRAVPRAATRTSRFAALAA